MSRIYVRHVTVDILNYKNTESILDEAILRETKTGALYKSIASFEEEGSAHYTLVFERT